MAKTKGLYPLIIESDLQNPMGLIIGKFESWSEIDWLICKIWALVDVVFMSLSRSYNLVACWSQIVVFVCDVYLSH